MANYVCTEMFSLICVIAASLLFTRLLRPRHRVEFLLCLTLVLPTLVFFLALALSAVNALGSVTGWSIAGLLALLAALAPAALSRPLRRRLLARPAGIADLRQRLRKARGGGRGLLLLLGATTLLAAGVNLALVLFTAPANLDSLSYHLARMAFYLQHGNFNYYDANYWAQVIHPKVATAQLLFLFLAGGRNENFTQLASYLAYGASLLAVYGSARGLGATRRGSLFAALAFGLFPVVLANASTAQNDLLLTAFAGATIDHPG